MLRRIGLCFIGLMAVTFILPWVAYWVGLSRISQLPLPPSHVITAEQREWVWGLARGSGVHVTEPMTPFSYLHALFSSQGTMDRDARVVGWVASDHLTHQDAVQPMFWWHLSSASLTIWLSRNWTDQQITTAAFAALQRRGEAYDGG